jgi:hypothetical protein
LQKIRSPIFFFSKVLLLNKNTSPSIKKKTNMIFHFFMTLLLFLLLLILSSTTSINAFLQRQSNYTFVNTSFNFFSTSIISPTSSFIVFATYEIPSQLVKLSTSGATSGIALSNRSVLSNLTLNSGENYVRCSCISPDGTTGYFGTETAPSAFIVKVNLVAGVNQTGMARIASLELTATGETNLWSSVMVPPLGTESLWGSWSSPARVLKVRNSDLTKITTLTFATGEDKLQSATITPDGSIALFGCWTGSPAGKIVKVDVALFTRLGVLTLDSGENFPVSAVISPDGSYALFGMDTTDFGRIVKVWVSNFTRAGALYLTAAQARLASAGIHPNGTHAFFGSAGTGPATISKINLANNGMFLEHSLTLRSGENYLWTGKVSPTANYAWFATYTSPASVIEVFTAVTTTTLSTTTVTLEPTVQLTTFVTTSSVRSTTTTVAPTNTTVETAVLSSGALAGVIVGATLFTLLLLFLCIIPWCMGQSAFFFVNKSVKFAAVCSDGPTEVVIPNGEPKFHHPHIKRKIREIQYIQEEQIRNGGKGKFYHLSEGSPVFAFGEDISTYDAQFTVEHLAKQKQRHNDRLARGGGVTMVVDQDGNESLFYDENIASRSRNSTRPPTAIRGGGAGESSSYETAGVDHNNNNNVNRVSPTRRRDSVSISPRYQQQRTVGGGGDGNDIVVGSSPSSNFRTRDPNVFVRPTSPPQQQQRSASSPPGNSIVPRIINNNTTAGGGVGASPTQQYNSPLRSNSADRSRQNITATAYVTSPTSTQQMANRNDRNTQYYYSVNQSKYTYNIHNATRDVALANQQKLLMMDQDDHHQRNEFNNNIINNSHGNFYQVTDPRELLPMPDAHRSPYPLHPQEMAVTMDAWSTPSGRTYGAQRVISPMSIREQQLSQQRNLEATSPSYLRREQQHHLPHQQDDRYRVVVHHQQQPSRRSPEQQNAVQRNFSPSTSYQVQRGGTRAGGYY